MPRKKVTGEVLERMKKLKKEGLTYQELAEKTSLSRPTVAEYLRKGRLEGRKAGSLEKLMVKMKKWEPAHRKVLRDEVSIDRGASTFSLGQTSTSENTRRWIYTWTTRGNCSG